MTAAAAVVSRHALMEPFLASTIVSHGEFVRKSMERLCLKTLFSPASFSFLLGGSFAIALPMDRLPRLLGPWCWGPFQSDDVLLQAAPKKKVTRRTIQIRHHAYTPKNRQNITNCQTCGSLKLSYSECSFCFKRYRNLVRLCQANGYSDFPDSIRQIVRSRDANIIPPSL